MSKVQILLPQPTPSNYTRRPSRRRCRSRQTHPKPSADAAEPPAGPSACPTAYNHPADEGRDHPGPGHILAKRCSSKTAMPVRGWRVWDGISMTSTSGTRSEEHTSELQSLMRISYAVFCL